MHFDLKSISTDGVPKALEKAERYRLLNEPSLAESIYMDILTILPSHQQALVSLLLARTDQFDRGVALKSAQEVLPRIEGEYERAYYAGIIWERMGHAHLRQGGLGSSANAYHALREAMEHYERAEALRPPANDNAILRWNACARVIMRNPEIRPIVDSEVQPITGE
jgi:tetratricopeptide (TPR) repeat protein